MPSTNKNEFPKISVADFIEKSSVELDIEILEGEKGLKRKQIVSKRIQKLGLALTGFTHYIQEGSIQIVGQSEISYLSQLEKAQRIEAINNLDLEKICCILIPKKLEPPAELLKIADERQLPILRTAQTSSNAVGIISKFLSEILAPQTTRHGVLVGMYGLGVLLLGESGIGKSECALDLIARGHRLVADDAVLIKRIGENLEGFSPELTYEHLEIRGLGIVNVRALFGISAVADRKKIELCIEFKKWKDAVDVERLGLDAREEEIFGVKLTKFILPVSGGRNLSVLVETAVRVHLLKMAGFDAAQKLIAKHSTMVGM
ncbi:MAG: HPr(Ser) kinase/phosphatase [Acidobacteriota bacterium]